MKRYHITEGASTTAGGKVVAATSAVTIDGVRGALEGDSLYCPACKSAGKIKCVGPRIPETWNGKPVALSDDLCICGCPTPPKLMPNQTRKFQATGGVSEYGPANDNEDEMFAIASVLVRQYKARGYPNISEFANKESTFSFVVMDGNPRYAKLTNATSSQIDKHAGMTMAVRAATNALNDGPDKSNGAFFWDGADIKSNYKRHFKVRHGIRFTEQAHNIYDIEESRRTAIIYKTTKIRNKANETMRIVRREIARFDHQYVSTAAHGGTIFWKFNSEYLKATRGKEYK